MVKEMPLAAQVPISYAPESCRPCGRRKGEGESSSFVAGDLHRPPQRQNDRSHAIQNRVGRRANGVNAHLSPPGMSPGQLAGFSAYWFSHHDSAPRAMCRMLSASCRRSIG